MSFLRPDEIFNRIYITGSSGIGALFMEFNREDAILNAVFDNTNAALRITTVGSTGDTTYFPGNIHADGNIIGEQYIVSSSVVYVTQSYMSGSTIFGDTQDDIHQFTGSVSITGSLDLNDINIYTELNSTRVGSGSVASGSTAINFSSALPSTNYSTNIRCFDGSGNNIDYALTNKLASGFTITPVIDCTIEYISIINK